MIHKFKMNIYLGWAGQARPNLRISTHADLYFLNPYVATNIDIGGVIKLNMHKKYHAKT